MVLDGRCHAPRELTNRALQIGANPTQTTRIATVWCTLARSGLEHRSSLPASLAFALAQNSGGGTWHSCNNDDTID
eukprot:5905192-Lingulodinium_polyedra.AAC.1